MLLASCGMRQVYPTVDTDARSNFSSYPLSIGITTVCFVSTTDTVAVAAYPQEVGECVAMTADHPLAQRFRQARQKVGKSNRKIAEEAGVAPATVDRMMNGDVDSKVDNLDKVAAALGVPEREARYLAGLPPVSGGPYSAPSESRLLDDRQRSALDELIRSIVATKGTGRAVPSPQTASSGTPQTVHEAQEEILALLDEPERARVRQILKARLSPNAVPRKHPVDRRKHR